jgi:ParB family chromosome partitioning protein
MAAKKTPALGKGLEALLGNAAINKNDADVSSLAAELSYIPLSKIEPNPDQPRKEFDEETLAELAQSIKENGIIVPLTVIKENGKYILIAGERRYRAAKSVGLKDVPAYIRIATKKEVMEMALVENIQREDLNAIEIALSLKGLIEECNLTQEQMSERIGKNRSTITNYLRLLKLPAEVQLALKNDAISMGHARCLINLESESEQIEIMKKIIEKELSVRQVEELVKQNKEKTQPKSKTKKQLPEYHSSKKESLSSLLDTSIEIMRSQRGKGKITIAFKNDKDFERIMELLESGR